MQLWIAWRAALALIGLFGVGLMTAAWGQSAPPNEEMTAIFKADQAARASSPLMANAPEVAASDKVRRARTRELLQAEALSTGDDFFHAAFVFQHGDRADDFLLAHVLAMAAQRTGRTEASWIAAATLDRYLQAIGRPQVLGTQFKFETKAGADGAASATQEPFNADLVPDGVRRAVGVPVRSEQEKQRQEIQRTLERSAKERG